MTIIPIEKDNRFLRQTISDLTEQIDLLSMLQDMSRQLIAQHDYHHIIDMFLNTVKEIIDYRSAALFMSDNSDNSWKQVRLSGEPDEALARFEIDDSIIDWVLKEGRWIHVRENHACDSIISIQPIHGSQKALGFLLMTSSTDNSAFTQANIKLLSFVAGQTGIALENQQLYERLHRSCEYTENILECINNGIITINPENRITLINKNATAMLGLPSADVLGMLYYDAIPKPIAVLFDTVRQQAVEKGFAMETVFEYTIVADTTITMAVGASLLRTHEEDRAGIVFILRDLSASKELERLRRLDKLKSEFVSNVSHELRTPLSIIKSYAEAVLHQVAPNDLQTRHEFLTVINDETDRLSRLVNDLLDIARIESGRFELALRPESFPEIIEWAVSQINKTSDVHDIALSIPEGLPLVLADRDKLCRVFFNLLDNAVKFSPAGGTIAVTASAGGSAIQCSIADHGIGISEADFERIFDKFFRSEAAESNNIAGTGLGLPLVKHIVESHGGTISLSSRFGSGSTFTVSLPAAVSREGGAR